MTRPRKDLIHLDTTPYYHCVSRCVRRAYLCGRDTLTRRSFEHRKRWLIERFAVLAEIFAIEVCAYAVMSNHYHLVLRVDTVGAGAWTDADVVTRWARLYGNAIARKADQGESLSSEENAWLQAAIPVWRARLRDISWFMRSINEPLARAANEEDGCTGRFWEGRFKSQALADEAALLACLVYVDLNPIRAGLAKTLQASNFTSIQQRIDRRRHPDLAARAGEATSEQSFQGSRPRLTPFADERPRVTTEDYLPIDFASYLALVDWTGRAIRHDKKGSIPESVAPTLAQLGIDAHYWIGGVQRFNREFHSIAGTLESLQAWCARLGQRWLKGYSFSKRIFGAACDPATVRHR